MGRTYRVAMAGAVVAGTMIAWQQPAFAACHAFTIAASPASVPEGGTVTVTVARDGAIGQSNVDVSSVNETAQAGSDFSVVQRTVRFSTETRQTFTVPVTNDADAEPEETFRLHLSNPGGCDINPNFSLGPDAQVRIEANDTAPPPPSTAPPTTAEGPSSTAPRPTSTTPAASEATTSTETTGTTAEPSSTTSSSTTEAGDPTDATDTTDIDGEALGGTEDDDGGSGSLGAFALIAAALGLGAVGYLLYRRRSRPAT
jgi:hypothetical protein